MNKQGFVGVVTVLIVTVIALTLGTSIAFLGINEVLVEYDFQQGQEVAEKADGCLEEGSYRLKLDASYTGGTIVYDEGSCTLTVTGGGSTRTLSAEVVIGDFTRIYETEISLQNNVAGNTDGLDLTSWQEQ